MCDFPKSEFISNKWIKKLNLHFQWDQKVTMGEMQGINCNAFFRISIACLSLTTLFLILELMYKVCFVLLMREFGTYQCLQRNKNESSKDWFGTLLCSWFFIQVELRTNDWMQGLVVDTELCDKKSPNVHSSDFIAATLGLVLISLACLEHPWDMCHFAHFFFVCAMHSF